MKFSSITSINKIPISKDSNTVIDKIAELKEKYALDKVIFVGDRGMHTQVNYDQIDHETVKIISALTHTRIKALMEEEIIQLGLFDEKNIVEVMDGNMRYCLCKNPEMEVKERRTRQALLKKTTEAIDKIIASTRKSKYSKQMRIGKVLNKHNMGKFFVFEGEGDQVTYTLDQAKIDQEASLDGCYIICTDVDSEDMSTTQTVENYKSLIQVEQAFRNMKVVGLEIRPVYHKTDDRIKCHVFICMLAYYVMWHMKQRLQPLFESDGKGAHRKYTFDNILESLKSIRKETVEFLSATTNIITTPTDEQRHILALLGVKL
jgi:transposase